MNLHNIANAAISAVNPNQTAAWQQSTGSTVQQDYSRAPDYAPSVNVTVQPQALTYRDLVQLDGLNLNGEAKAFYVNGKVSGVSRPGGTGGDLFTLPDSSIWLAVHVLENWDATAGWTKVAVVRQTQ